MQQKTTLNPVKQVRSAVLDLGLEYNGIKLPNLSGKSSVLYHTICISYLRGMANDPTALQSGEVLAAITILRFHEQVDSKSYGSSVCSEFSLLTPEAHFTKLYQEI